jgi:hypothetical protein
MDAFDDRFPYRCLPIVQANSCGWELLCSHDLAIEWNGGPRIEDLKVKNLSKDIPTKIAANSWFSRGIVTFHSGYIFRISNGYQLLATGPLNNPKHGISPLAGMLDTSRLPFTFTMNWMMTKSGTVIFEKDEPFCLIIPIQTASITNVQPEIRSLSSDKDLERSFDAYVRSRESFIDGKKKEKPAVISEKWQKFYVKGVDAEGVRIAPPLQKVRSKEPVRTEPDIDLTEE